MLGKSFGMMSNAISRPSTSTVTTPVARSATPKAAAFSPVNTAKSMMQTSLTGAQNSLAQPFSLESLGKSPYAADFLGEKKNVSDAYYNTFKRAYEPVFQQQNQDFTQSMADRGIQAGNDLYNRQYQNVQQAQNQARQNAMDQALLASGQEQSRLYNMASDARQQALNEYMLGRSQPLTEATSLAGLWQGLGGGARGGGGGGRRGGGGGGIAYNPLAGMDLSSLYAQPEQPSQPSVLEQGLYSFGVPLAQKAVSSGVDWLGKKAGDFLGGLFGGGNTSAYDQAASTGWW